MTQSFQVRHDAALNKIGSVKDEQLKNILDSTNSKFDYPADISLNGDVLTIDVGLKFTQESDGQDGLQDSYAYRLPLIGGLDIQPVESSIDLTDGSTTGDFANDPETCPVVTAGRWIKMGIELRDDGKYYTVFGTEGLLPPACGAPVLSGEALSICIVILYSTAGGQWNFDTPSKNQVEKILISTVSPLIPWLTMHTDVIPDTNAARTLGDSTHRWNAYFDHTEIISEDQYPLTVKKSVADSGGAYLDAPVTTLRAYYKLDESSGNALDSSGLGNDLTASANPPDQGASGINSNMNTSRTFNPTNSEFFALAGISTTNSSYLTIDACFKLANFTDGSYTIFDFWISDTNYGNLKVVTTGGVPVLHWEWINSAAPDLIGGCTCEIAHVTPGWNYVKAAVIKNNYKYLYLNGKLVDKKESPSGCGFQGTGTTSTWTIGRQFKDTTDYFHGNIQIVRLSSTDYYDLNAENDYGVLYPLKEHAIVEELLSYSYINELRLRTDGDYHIGRLSYDHDLGVTLQKIDHSVITATALLDNDGLHNQSIADEAWVTADTGMEQNGGFKIREWDNLTKLYVDSWNIYNYSVGNTYIGANDLVVAPKLGISTPNDTFFTFGQDNADFHIMSIGSHNSELFLDAYTSQYGKINFRRWDAGTSTFLAQWSIFLHNTSNYLYSQYESKTATWINPDDGEFGFLTPTASIDTTINIRAYAGEGSAIRFAEATSGFNGNTQKWKLRNDPAADKLFFHNASDNTVASLDQNGWLSLDGDATGTPRYTLCGYNPSSGSTLTSKSIEVLLDGDATTYYIKLYKV
jgi:hypothetical protein